MMRFEWKIYYFLLFSPALILAPATKLAAEEAISVESNTTLSAIGTPQTQHFIRLDSSGNQIASPPTKQQWPCVFDDLTKLTWEIKSNKQNSRNAKQTYSWFVPAAKTNGGFSGYKNKGICLQKLCNTQAYVDRVNRRKLCSLSNWRLPTREELRSIVNYQIEYPGPTIDNTFFPHTQNQFYWSSTPDADDKDSAWGIGFSFGYDYAYFKSDHGYIRLVSGPKK
jgi:hypothetical protein